MKHNLIWRMGAVIYAVILLNACETVSHHLKTREISARRAADECPTPEVFYTIPPTSFGISLRLMRHKNCMGIPDLLMVLWEGERTELHETIAKAIALMFIDSANLTNRQQMGRIFLKTDQLESGFYIDFYELVVIDPRDYKGKTPDG
jgi:hypothetical protein